MLKILFIVIEILLVSEFIVNLLGKKSLGDKIAGLVWSKVKFILNKETNEMFVLKKEISRAIEDVDYSKGLEKVAEAIIDELSPLIIDRKISSVKAKFDKEKDLGFYRRSEDMIYINNLYIHFFLSEEGSIYEFNELLKTCCHELRHAWQHDNGWDFSHYVTPEDDEEKYMFQRCEVDARVFSFYVVHFVMNSKMKEKLLRHVLRALKLN